MGNRGTSLVELLVGILLLGVFAVVVHQFFRTVLHGVRVLEVASEAQEAARIGVQQMVRDLRGAGFSPNTPLPDGIRLATADAVEVQSDLNGDGDTADANEVVGYSLSRSARTLMRTLGQAPPQPMIPDLAPDGLALAYLDADGMPLPMANGRVDDGDRERIRRIDVILRIEIAHPDPAYRQPLRALETATVALRNR
jgi:type II secretory pathway pseudopilin PulG